MKYAPRTVAIIHNKQARAINLGRGGISLNKIVQVAHDYKYNQRNKLPSATCGLEVSPKGSVADRLEVARFTQTKLAHGGPRTNSAPLRSCNTRIRAFANPDLVGMSHIEFIYGPSTYRVSDHFDLSIGRRG